MLEGGVLWNPKEDSREVSDVEDGINMFHGESSVDFNSKRAENQKKWGSVHKHAQREFGKCCGLLKCGGNLKRVSCFFLVL